MVVQHNLQAMNANRMLGTMQNAQAKSTEKLSSGYRINRAADDAAGLSISEKMRKQIRGLDQATENAQDGISMVQIADGAMDEVLAMLQRGNELAVQASNGTNSASDRQAIQDEIDQLLTEINRVRETTKFNETYVLQGDIQEGSSTGINGALPDWLSSTSKSFSSATQKTYSDLLTSKSSANSGGTDWTGYGVKLDFSSVNMFNVEDLYGTGFCATCQGCGSYINVEFTEDAAGTSSCTQITQVTQADLDALGSTATLADVNKSMTLKVGIGGLTKGEDIVAAVLNAAAKANGGTWDGESAIRTRNAAGVHQIDIGLVKGSKSTLAVYDIRNTTQPSNATGYGQNGVNSGVFGTQKSYTPVYETLNIHVGADADMTNKINIKLANINTKAMGLENYNARKDAWTTVSCATEVSATRAITSFSNAIAYVSAERSRMGAYQNRLEHTVNNLSNVVENTTSAESRIRDTDMAEEMVTYSKNNILAQAGQSMLAQANQATQGVLSLLQ